MGIDSVGMGGNWNAKSHFRSSLVPALDTVDGLQSPNRRNGTSAYPQISDFTHVNQLPKMSKVRK